MAETVQSMEGLASLKPAAPDAPTYVKKVDADIGSQQCTYAVYSSRGSTQACDQKASAPQLREQQMPGQ